MSAIEQLLRACRDEALELAAAGLQMEDKGRPGGDPRVNIVTQADLALDRRIRAELTRLEPGVAFVSEELGGERTDGDCFVLDPIDGTHNFAAGLDHWAISLAKVRGEEVLEGWILGSDGVLFHAARGQGATADGQPIAVTDRNPAWTLLSVNLSQAVVPLILSSHRFSGVRVFGSHCLGLAWTARGDFGLHAGRGHAWDVAAGYRVLEEAGARITDLKGNPRSIWRREPALAGAPQVVDLSLEILAGA